VTDYRLVVWLRADLDIAEALEWYESRQPGLGVTFLEQLKATYDRIAASPLGYQKLRGEIRRAVIRRFPYAVYFIVEDSLIVVTAMLHLRRDPSVWQKRSG
jgi:plasmid stabilization system protein ParE